MKKRKAFTLIELLVVIGIIALLLAILMPSLQKARNQARATICQAHLKQWGTIFALYINDNDGRYFHFIGDALWFIRGSQLEEGDPNEPAMSTYVNAKGLGYCPMATSVPDNPSRFFHMRSSFSGSSYEIEGKTGSTFEAWELISPAPAFCASYGFNKDLFNETAIRNRHSGVSFYNYRSPYRFPVLLDSSSPFNFGHFDSSPFDPWFSIAISAFKINRHDGCINGLFMDWSVRKVKLKELSTLKWNKDFNPANIEDSPEETGRSR